MDIQWDNKGLEIRRSYAYFPKIHTHLVKFLSTLKVDIFSYSGRLELIHN